MTGLRVIALVLAPIWLLLISHILWALWGITHEFDPSVQDGDLRWHALAFVGLITSLGALISAPLALIRVWTTERQTRTAEQGHMTDRISKAVEQLGTEKTVKVIEEGESVEKTVPNIEVRIGALLSLERIAQDSVTYDNGRDHVRVMEILCAYVRENAPTNAARDDNPRDIWEAELVEIAEENAEHAERLDRTQAQELANERTGLGPDEVALNEQLKSWVRELPRPREDIQLALTIIGRRDADQRRVEARWGQDADAEWLFDDPCPRLRRTLVYAAIPEEKYQKFLHSLNAWSKKINTYSGYRLDLRSVMLSNADLTEGVFSGARLDGSRLEGALLSRTRLEGVNLSSARLDCSNLDEARLEGADLRGAFLRSASLKRSRLIGADLHRACLDSADASKTLMEGASLSTAYLEGIKLNEAQLEAAFFRKAKARRADLADAWIERADFSDCDLSEAILVSSWGEFAKFNRCQLQGADLRMARLNRTEYKSGTNLSGANLKECSLEHSDLNWAYLAGADLSSTNLKEASLASANLQRANLNNAGLERADLSRTSLDEADLRYARTAGANFQNSSLSGADLGSITVDEATDFSNASFKETALRRVDFRQTEISVDQMDASFGDATVILPAASDQRLRWPEHWPIWSLPDWVEHDYHAEWRKWRADPGSYTPPAVPDRYKN